MVGGVANIIVVCVGFTVVQSILSPRHQHVGVLWWVCSELCHLLSCYTVKFDFYLKVRADSNSTVCGMWPQNCLLYRWIAPGTTRRLIGLSTLHSDVALL
jgi:hypothetical protein